MKLKFLISSVLFVAIACVSVTCEAVTVPAATAYYEKAVLPTPVVFAAKTDGAIIKFTNKFDYTGGCYEVAYSLDRIFWHVDEHFYLNGYKAKLSTAVKEIIAPPDNKSKIYLDCIKQC